MKQPLTTESLRVFLTSDEGERLEFKSNILRRDEISEYAVAIGNEGGGHLIFGVTNTKPRKVIGIQELNADELQQIRRSVYDNANIRIEIDEVIVDGKRVLCVGIPTRLPGSPFHTKGGKYLMRSGEDLRGMTPVEIARILQEVPPPSVPRSVVKEMADLAAKNWTVRVRPSIPARLDLDFRVTAADERNVCLTRTSSTQEVVVPSSRLSEILWQGASTPVLTLDGRLQWISARKEWQFSPESPGTDTERQFGFFKLVGHQTLRVSETCKFFQNLGFALRWFNEHQLLNQVGGNWEIVYDIDGLYFKILDGRINQILAKTIQPASEL